MSFSPWGAEVSNVISDGVLRAEVNVCNTVSAESCPQFEFGWGSFHGAILLRVQRLWAWCDGKSYPPPLPFGHLPQNQKPILGEEEAL